MQVGFYLRHGQAGSLGNLFIVHPFHLAQVEHRPLLGRQALDEPVEMTEGIVGRCDPVGRACVEITSGRFLFPGTANLVGAQAINRLVLRHPHQPGWWVVEADDLVTLSPAFEQYILHHILRLVGVVDDPQRQPVKAVADGGDDVGVMVQKIGAFALVTLGLRSLLQVGTRKSVGRCFGVAS